ncbi:MAG: aminomethyl-transferring glycine dehydrogenase subunit GcvPA [Coriobacteriia bacterium]|nr:aminomethyl-transferring glycine dehydrogenase subunit GcvPA [Coriobacteriia bacterium]
MRYIPVTCEQREAMLRAVGVTAVDDLFAVIPEAVRFEGDLALADGLTEIELDSHLRRLAEANLGSGDLVSFLGAGCYDHYIPSIVDSVVSKPEFFTAYTPYQPEVSQGTLQAIYEYQTMICELTGMDVSNASMYDGATAFVEAALMACRVTRRHKVICAASVHPEWQNTLVTYAEAGVMEVGMFAPVAEDGTTLVAGEGELVGHGLAELLSAGDVGAVLVQSPNFFGNFEDLAAIGRLAHEAGALFVVAANPILLGIVEPPSAYGADIVVGEGQPLGNAVSYGGPGLGFFACAEKYVRQMPGRVVGRTVDVDGARAFVLTLSTREQHIRREKATSNICSNHALNALTACVYLAAVGQQGLAGIARSCVAKAHYLRDALLATGKFTAPWDTHFGYEFTLAYDGDVAQMHEALLDAGFLAGVSVADVEGEWPTGVENADRLVVFAVTEKRTREEMDAFVEEVAAL